MLIHEFVTNKTSDDKHARSAADLDMFLKRLSHGRVTSVQPGTIHGPIVVPGELLLTASVEIYVAKVRRFLRVPMSFPL